MTDWKRLHREAGKTISGGIAGGIAANYFPVDLPEPIFLWLFLPFLYFVGVGAFWSYERLYGPPVLPDKESLDEKEDDDGQENQPFADLNHAS